MTSLPLRHAAAALVLTFLLGAPARSVQAATRSACHCQAAATHAGHARHRLAHHRRNRAYVSVPRVPRYNPAEVEAEVHSIARYRTPYAYPALFGPF